MTAPTLGLPEVNGLVRVSLGDADSPDVSQPASRRPSRVEDVLLRPGGEQAAEMRDVLTRAGGGDLPDGRLVVHGRTVNDTAFAIPSRICWSLATGRDPVRDETALAFDDPRQFGDTLRPMLDGEQIRQRREGLI